MVEITVSNDNFNALIAAHSFERVCVKHKNLKGEIWLEKKYHEIPEPKYHEIPEPKTDKGVIYELIECIQPLDFCDKLDELLKQGFKVSSTGCSDGTWRAILIKEVNNNDKD